MFLALYWDILWKICTNACVLNTLMNRFCLLLVKLLIPVCLTNHEPWTKISLSLTTSYLSPQDYISCITSRSRVDVCTLPRSCRVFLWPMMVPRVVPVLALVSITSRPLSTSFTALSQLSLPSPLPHSAIFLLLILLPDLGTEDHSNNTVYRRSVFRQRLVL